MFPSIQQSPDMNGRYLKLNEMHCVIFKSLTFMPVNGRIDRNELHC